MTTRLPSASAGLGLRRALLDDLREAPAGAFDFLECAPDNWIGVGGRLGEALHALLKRMEYRIYKLTTPLFNPANWRSFGENLYPGIASFNLLCVPRERDDVDTEGLGEIV